MTQHRELSFNQRTLLNSLTRELLQTEASALRHCNREAARYDNAPPARALRAVACHAQRVLAELPGLAERNDLIISKRGMLVAELFSQGRDKIADMMFDSERSYRGTLLGMREGVDLFRLLNEFAHVVHIFELRSFTHNWLEERLPLVQRVDEELRWFAQDADAAVRMRRVWSSRLRGVVRLIAH